MSLEICLVERLYCKRPIQCLASSKILTSGPHPLTARRVCAPAFGAGGGHTRWMEKGGGGKYFGRRHGHSSVLYICKYFVVIPYKCKRSTERGSGLPSAPHEFQLFRAGIFQLKNRTFPVKKGNIAAKEKGNLPAKERAFSRL
jgi:hypothetical protein